MAALRYLFDRPMPKEGEDEWYWNIDEPEFEATPLEWTRIQTVLFAQSGSDLSDFGDEQVGMGLNYLMSNSVSNVSFAVIDETVPIDEAMRLMQALPILWQDCIGPRLAGLNRPIGSSNGHLAYVAYMWFEAWPISSNVRHTARWREAIWALLTAMLAVPCRLVQLGALHGIGHEGPDLVTQDQIDQTIASFLRSADSKDDELKNYAEAARQGRVQ